MNYSFISESKKHLLKILSRYTPEEVAKIRERMISLGKQKGGWYSKSEYARKIIDGQRKRISNIAKQNNRKIKFIDSNGIDSAIYPAADIRYIKKPGLNWDGTIDPKQYSIYRNRVRGYDIAYLPEVSKKLSSADITSHEADEYALAFLNAKRLGLHKNVNNELTHIYNSNNPGQHHIGVLKREKKRHDLFDTLYGVGKPILRSDFEYKHNNIKLKKLLKYLEKVKNDDSYNALLQFPTRDTNLKILKDQKKNIENFINRLNEIKKLPDGLQKSVQFKQLIHDIQNFNYNLPNNLSGIKWKLSNI